MLGTGCMGGCRHMLGTECMGGCRHMLGTGCMGGCRHMLGTRCVAPAKTQPMDPWIHREAALACQRDAYPARGCVHSDWKVACQALCSVWQV